MGLVLGCVLGWVIGSINIFLQNPLKILVSVLCYVNYWVFFSVGLPKKVKVWKT